MEDIFVGMGVLSFFICILILVVFFFVIENFDGYFAWPAIAIILSFPLGVQQQRIPF